MGLFGKKYKTAPGFHDKLGATLYPNGVNFAVFSKNAVSVKLMLFKNNNLKKPFFTVDFDKNKNKTEDIWHIFIYDIANETHYGYVIDGHYDPVHTGNRFNPNKLLLDPYAKAVSGKCYWHLSNAYGFDLNSNYGDLSFSKEKNYDTEVKSIVYDSDFNWENDKPLNTPLKDSIIYEMHIRGFTADKSSGVKYPGTYLGVIEKIPYLKELGITAIELLPIFEFNELEDLRFNPKTQERLKNFWGYSPLCFFAPESWYSATFNSIDAINEFKTMVKALHKAGLEIILDVVFNHTGEGNEYGPTISFKGIDNSSYYMLDKKRRYKNYSGCGNTINCNHPAVKKFIIDCLRYWVQEMHVDGFRFDLATILGRDENGEWLNSYSLLTDISSDPYFTNTKIIAECWDMNLYKVGAFPSGWAEWNGKYRDDICCFMRGDKNKTIDTAYRIFGSPDIFHLEEKKPYHSINFISCHDGFTLQDIVSYNHKHNETNGENNKDGSNLILNFNFGIEGETDIKEVNDIRERQMKNFILLLMISHGTPMLLSGDEVKFSKQGNNNSYCQDNKINWLDWGLIEKNKAYFDFCKYAIRFRLTHPSLRRENFISYKDMIKNHNEVTWHGVTPNMPDWSADSHSLAFALRGELNEENSRCCNLFIAINSFWRGLIFNLPKTEENKNWFYCFDTFESPGFFDENREKPVESSAILVNARSIVILMEK